MREDQRVSIEHRERMLAYLAKQRAKLEKEETQTLLPTKETREKLKKNGHEPFNIETAPPWELDKEIKRKRIKNLEARTMTYELDLARIREEVIEKELVLKQLSFMLVSIRQKMLAIPTTYARKLLHKSDLREIHSILQGMMYEVLEELKHLPMKVTDPNWLEKLDEEE